MKKPTKEEILNESAGKRMDSWMAEYVMEWKQRTAPGHVRGDYWWETENGIMVNPNECSFSRSMPAAWKVVEKLKDLEFYFELGDNHYRDKWYACFGIITIGKEFWEFADTASLAICRAALLAKLELA